MLFKRVFEGKSALKNIKGTVEKCNAKVPIQCNDCNHCNVFEEIMKVVVLSLALWVGITYGGLVVPYPLNFLVSADIMYPPPMYEYPFPSLEVLKKLPAIKEKHLNQSVIFGRNSVDMLRRLEDNLGASGIVVEQGSAGHGQLINGYPSEEAMNIHKSSWIVTKASNHLADAYCVRYGVADEECATYISRLSLRNTAIGEECAALHNPICSDARKTSKYRSFDGSCNNLVRGSLGKATTGLKRLLHPKYTDGIDEPRKNKANKPLPHARTISAAIAADLNTPDAKRTLAIMQWAQFIEHDLVHVPLRKMVHSGNSISCCDKWGRALSPRYQHPSCLSMAVQRKDPFYGDHRVTCLTYTRSVTTFRSDCTFGAAEQMNQATHFLDGSQVYGSNINEAMSLRKKQGGLMKVQELDEGAFLPQAAQPKERCQVDKDTDTCFTGGDIRVNTHPLLATMHTLWLREHNRIAKELAVLNPTWKDDILYQEARRIVIAEMQHITYAQWLPSLTGKMYDDKFDSYDISYKQELDPSITNSLATAGLRFTNSLLDGTIHLVEEDRSLNESLELMQHFNRPDVVTQPDKFEKLVRGLTSQPSQSMDLHLVDDITNQLYSPKGQKVGLDVLSFDIQRGRDHGLPAYHLYRVLCHLNPAAEFEDFADSIPPNIIEQLKKLYTHPHDVDLIVGAMAEKPLEGSLLGPTFSCLLGEQLSRTRSGDRYFYSNSDQPEPFTQQQLVQLTRSTLARVICDNVPQIKTLQKDVFSLISPSNNLVSCEDGEIKRVNLAAWQDPLHKPDIITRTKRNVAKFIKHKA